MNNSIEKKLQDGKRLVLTSAEKASVRDRLSQFADTHTSRLSPRGFTPVWSVFGVAVLRQRFSLVVAILLIFALTTGTSFAAQKALPGEPLYAFKIQVNEKVESLLALSPKASAEVAALHATRRLEEAEKLEIEGKLTPEIHADVTAQFQAEVKAMDVETDELESSGDFESAVEVKNNFEDVLTNHYKVLVGLAGKATTTNTTVRELTKSIRGEIDVTANKRIETEGKKIQALGEAAAASSTIKALADAEDTLSQVELYVNARISATTSSEVRGETNSKLKKASDYVKAGNAKLKNKVYGDAFTLFQKAKKTASEVKTTVDIEESLQGTWKDFFKVESTSSATTSGKIKKDSEKGKEGNDSHSVLETSSTLNTNTNLDVLDDSGGHSGDNELRGSATSVSSSSIQLPLGL